jgi:uncharacterized membrane protein HdeD (DUF308 family)
MPTPAASDAELERLVPRLSPVEWAFTRSWRAVAGRGIAGLAFGVLAFLWPSLKLPTLFFVFGVYALADGILVLVAGALQRAPALAWTLGLEGLLGMAMGYVSLTRSWPTPSILVRTMASWAVLTGALEIVAGLLVQRELPGEVFFLLAGVGSLLLGVLMLLWPGAGPLAYALFLGSYAIFFGADMLALAVRMKRTFSRVD